MIIPYYQINVTSDERTNSLVVRAPENIQKQIQAILEIIDNPKNTKSLVSIKLTHVPANDLSIIIQNLINFKYSIKPGICISENKMNKIIILEEPNRLEELSKIISEIDTKPKYYSAAFITKLKNAKADNLANLLNNLR